MKAIRLCPAIPISTDVAELTFALALLDLPVDVIVVVVVIPHELHQCSLTCSNALLPLLWHDGPKAAAPHDIRSDRRDRVALAVALSLLLALRDSDALVLTLALVLPLKLRRG